jgi:hypothetical protein
MINGPPPKFNRTWGTTSPLAQLPPRTDSDANRKVFAMGQVGSSTDGYGCRSPVRFERKLRSGTVSMAPSVPG